jgi:hypothetical protein
MATLQDAHIRDVDIRRSLHAEMRRRHQAEVGTLILDELALCQGTARVDVAVVNGSLHGYEIKSASDTLERLPGQCSVYSRALDYVTIVTSEKHARKIRRLVPRWWGIWAAYPTATGIELCEVREPRINPRVDGLAIAELLWRQEVLEELESRSLLRGLRGKPRRALWAKLADSIPLPELQAIVRERLKGRAGWRAVSRLM